jgi:Glyoxalase-like domain
MAARICNITFDCDDALKVGSFWAEVLGRKLDPGSDPGYASIGGSDAERSDPALFFEKVPESKAVKNRVHLDLVDPDSFAVSRFATLGASIVAEHQIGSHRWTVMQDPEGNEFCVAQGSFTG